jgi:hypothetical protein
VRLEEKVMDNKRGTKLRETFVAVEPPCGQSPPNHFPGKFLVCQSKRAGKTLLAPSLAGKIVPKPLLGLNYGSDSD